VIADHHAHRDANVAKAGQASGEGFEAMRQIARDDDRIRLVGQHFQNERLDPIRRRQVA
jgi:hypothetical protein